MQPSKLTPAIFLRWILFIIGFYLFYISTYILMAKLATVELSSYLSKSDFLAEFKSGDAFWYSMFILCWLIVLYVTTLFVSYAPKRKTAVFIYIGLVLVSQILLLVALPTDIKLLPHLFINGSFVVVLLLSLWKKKTGLV